MMKRQGLKFSSSKEKEIKLPFHLGKKGQSSFFFHHKFSLIASNQECKIILDIYSSKIFQWHKECLIWTTFTLYIFLSNI
jgi:hypothetical protein